MSDYLQFVLAMVVLVIGWGLWSLRTVNLFEYLKTKTGKGILKGVLLACTFALVFALSAPLFAGTWFNDAEVYAGLDYTKKSNPMCVTGTVDDNSGSNIGLSLNVYRDGNFSLNSKYTHHSCAFSEDDRSYDGVGVELRYKFWER